MPIPMLNIDSRLRETIRTKTGKHFASCMGVLEALGDRMNKQGECWPSIATIAKESGFGVVKVRRIQKILKKEGFLTWKERPQQTHKYKLPKGLSRYYQNDSTIKTIVLSKEYPPTIKKDTPLLSKRRPEVLSIEVLSIEVLELKEDKENLIFQVFNMALELKKLKEENHRLTTQLKNQDVKEKEKICAKKEKTLVKKKEPPKYLSELNRVLSYFTAKTGQSFNVPSQSGRVLKYEAYKLLSARLEEGFLITDFKKVIDIKFNEWWGDKKNQKYIRPSTLFCAKHFENYLEEYNLNQRHPIKDGQQTNRKSNRSESGVSDEFKNGVSAVCKSYFPEDGSEFLKRWANQSNANDDFRTS